MTAPGFPQGAFPSATTEVAPVVPAPPSGFDPKASRLLVVDDEAANLKLLSLMLRTEGYHQVKLLQDPRDAVGCYQALQPDLILLDLNMPHVSGFEVLGQLKALAGPAMAPVVVLTAQSGDEVLLRAFQAGASDFLSKPFNRRELMVRVHNLLLAQQGRRALEDQNARLETMVRQRTQQLRDSRLDIVRRLGRASEFRDNETGAHILRMSHASALLARHAGWDAAACELMLNASPMHDVGKIGIPDGILLKPGPLTPEERDIMQTHTLIGAEILGDAEGSGGELIRMARDIALSHHEKWDGSGYPHGLAGEAIPEAGRIVAIADVFDALTSARPYKKPWTVEDATHYLRSNAGKHFDPRLLRLFLDLLPEVRRMAERYADAGPQALEDFAETL